jgi:hypothetical protein
VQSRAFDAVLETSARKMRRVCPYQHLQTRDQRSKRSAQPGARIAADGYRTADPAPQGADPRRIAAPPVTLSNVNGFFVSPRRVILCSLLLMENDSMNAHRVPLRDSALPDAFEYLVELSFWVASFNFVDERNILPIREDQRELFFRCGENVKSTILGSVNDLDIFHGFRLDPTYALASSP